MHSCDPCIHEAQVGEREQSRGGRRRQRAVRKVHKTRWNVFPVGIDHAMEFLQQDQGSRMPRNEVFELVDDFSSRMVHPTRLDGDLPQPSEPNHSE